MKRRLSLAHVWMIVCSTGDLHPQEFQAGRSRYGAYETHKAAKRGADVANMSYQGHTVIKVPLPAGRAAAQGEQE